MIETIKYLILGIIQGITEPLPISSSGHLLIFRNLFNTNMFNDLNFEIFVNFGSFIAILIYFFNDIKDLITNFFKYLKAKKDEKKQYKSKYLFVWYLIISTIPAGLIGLLFKDYIEKLASIKMVGYALLITAIALFLVKNTKGTKEDKDISLKDAIIIGLFQMFALFPGLSRSGMTLVGCLLCGLSRTASLKYTFLLYFPISIASFSLSFMECINTLNSNLLLNYTIGLAAATIVTYITYDWLANYVKKGQLWRFSIYCLIVGLFVLIYFR